MDRDANGDRDESRKVDSRVSTHSIHVDSAHTDTVVVVASNPLKPGEREPRTKSRYSEKKRAEPLVRLLRDVAPNVDPEGMGFGQLRDELLKVDPLNVEHVKRVNAAEAEFWKRSAGVRVDWSDQILGFDCGGQQHVLEVAFPAGELERMPHARRTPALGPRRLALHARLATIDRRASNSSARADRTAMDER